MDINQINKLENEHEVGHQVITVSLIWSVFSVNMFDARNVSFLH